MVITSADNKILKLVQKLSRKKYRDETGLFVAEGWRSVNDIASCRPELIEHVLVSESKRTRYPTALAVRDDLLNRLTETEQGQGLLAVVRKPDALAFTSDYALFLDGIRDPGNLGTLIRTACAAGYGDVLLRDCADPYNGKVVRSTMSAIVKVNISEADVADLLSLKEKGHAVIAADMNGSSVFVRRATGKKICVVVGGEANGITDEVKDVCDEIRSIPMEGEIESLNAAVSGALLMYILKYDK